MSNSLNFPAPLNFPPAMKFKVIEIEFDFTGDDSSEEVLSVEEQNEICENVLSTVWEADDEDDLIEEITCAAEWCITRIDYFFVLD